MKANELVGKWVLRTAPAVYPTGCHDRSYSHGTPILIVKATDDHFVIYNKRADYFSELDMKTWGNDWIEADNLSAKSIKLFGRRIILI